MPVRPQIAWLVLMVLLIAGLIYHHARIQPHGGPVEAVVAAPAVEKSSPPVADTTAPDAGETAGRVLRLRRDQVLATVNGHPITLREAVPASGTNDPQEISAEDLKFFLNRAVDRELIFENARAQGVMLDDSQNAQLAQFRSLRAEPEPGLVQQLNPNPPENDLEMLDAEAFMLQAGLLAKSGASPNVSADEVSQYYHQHAAEFIGVPMDMADYQIRTLLAPLERSKFQDQLATYMNQVRSAAAITQMSM